MTRMLFEDGQIRVKVGKTATYFTSDGPHCNFPHYVKLANGDIYISHSVGTHVTSEKTRYAVSRDGGKT